MKIIIITSPLHQIKHVLLTTSNCISYDEKTEEALHKAGVQFVVVEQFNPAVHKVINVDNVG